MKDDLEKLHIDDSDCMEAMDHLYAYLSGELGDKVLLSKVEHHISHCKSCFSRAELERELNKRLTESSRDEPSVALKKRLRDLLDNL